MSNVVWEKRSKRCIISIVASSNWKGGIPKNPQIKKWLVKIKDKWLKDEYCPTDWDLINFVPHNLDLESLKLVAEAFRVKEKHNRANLINPEIRHKEEQFEAIIRGIEEKSNSCR